MNCFYSNSAITHATSPASIIPPPILLLSLSPFKPKRLVKKTASEEAARS